MLRRNSAGPLRRVKPQGRLRRNFARRSDQRKSTEDASSPDVHDRTDCGLRSCPVCGALRRWRIEGCRVNRVMLKMNYRIKKPALPASTAISPLHSGLPLGCWLVTPRRGYLHHGVYAGNGLVVHYAGLSRSWRRGPVEVVSLSEFSRGERLWVRWTPAARHAGLPAVRRALSRLGEDAYRILTNNCEHFCAWCVEGDSRSLQVERWLAWPRAIVRATVPRIAQHLGISMIAHESAPMKEALES